MKSPVSIRLPTLRELLLLGGLAALPRLLNLGTFSMWLDEILETQQVRASLAQAWQALQADGAHPPLEGLISWVLIHLGASESTRRLLPVALGVATVIILARWAGRRFGRLVGLLTGVLGALSPLHVHYSQELRPYALGLFFCALALDRLDALLRSPGRRNLLLLWIVCLGCLLSFYFAAPIFVPLALLALGEARSRSPEIRRLLRRAPLFLGALALACVPWIPAVQSLRQRPIEAVATAWTGPLAGQRWQFLTVGGVEGSPLAWGGIFSLAVCLVGVAAGLRSVAGRAVVGGALAGTVGIDLSLLWVDHWSNGRYNLVAWPFLTVLAALGVTTLAGWLGTVFRRLRLRPAPAILAAVVLCPLLAAQIQGIGEYYRGGRAQWHRLARAVAALHRPGEPILAGNGWTKICLGHYLDGLPDARDVRREPVSLDGDPDRAFELWDPGDCALLVVGGYPSSDRLGSVLGIWSQPLRLKLGGAWLFLLDARTRGGGLAPCRERFLPRELRRPPPITVLPRSEPRESLRLEFDRATTEAALLYGWSGFEASPDGTSFVWAAGRRAALGIYLEQPRALSLRLELWPLVVAGRRQRLSASLNGRPLGELELEEGRQLVELAAPVQWWREGENVLVFTFGYALAPADLDPGSGDSRRLAAAFDRLTLVDTNASR